MRLRESAGAAYVKERRDAGRWQRFPWITRGEAPRSRGERLSCSESDRAQARCGCRVRRTRRAAQPHRAPAHDQRQRAPRPLRPRLAHVDRAQTPRAVAVGAQHGAGLGRRRHEQASDGGDRLGDDRRQHATPGQIEDVVAAALEKTHARAAADRELGARAVVRDRIGGTQRLDRRGRRRDERREGTLHAVPLGGELFRERPSIPGRDNDRRAGTDDRDIGS
jgi:hypothetical protein